MDAGTNMFASLTTDVAMQVLDQITALIPTVLPSLKPSGKGNFLVSNIKAESGYI